MRYSIFKNKFIIFFAIFFLIPFVITQFSFAQPAPFNKADLSLGGIVIGDSIDKVTKSYGQPLNIKKFDQNNFEYSYKNIKFRFNRHNEVNYIGLFSLSNDDTPISTPRGIVIENSVADLLRVYGKPTFKDSLEEGIITYTYGVQRSTFLLSFDCDSRTNKIVRISLYDAV